MRRIWRPAACATAALAVALALVLAAGCGGGSDGPTTSQEPAGTAPAGNGPSDGDRGDGSGSGSGNGSGSGASAGSLPDDWPGQFPDPPAGATFKGYLGAASGDRSEYLATYTVTDGDVADIHEYYQDALAAAGWEQAGGMSVVTETTTMTPFQGFDAEGSVTVQRDRPDDPVTITIIMHVSH
jgi:hypothetical protein